MRAVLWLGLMASGVAFAGPVAELKADGSFKDGGRGWQQTTWKPRKATIETEAGNRHLTLAVAKGTGDSVFTEAEIPADCAAVKVRLQTRCRTNGGPDHPAIMILFGKKGSLQGKPLRLTPNGEWETHEVIVRFRPGRDNHRFQIDTIASPLDFDVDDIELLEATAEEEEPPPSWEP